MIKHNYVFHWADYRSIWKLKGILYGGMVFIFGLKQCMWIIFFIVVALRSGFIIDLILNKLSFGMMRNKK